MSTTLHFLTLLPFKETRFLQFFTSLTLRALRKPALLQKALCKSLVMLFIWSAGAVQAIHDGYSRGADMTEMDTYRWGGDKNADVRLLQWPTPYSVKHTL